MTKFLMNAFDEAERITKVRGKWVVATVAPKMSWPPRKQIMVYEDKMFVLLPEGKEMSAGIALNAGLYKLDSSAARKIIMRFCSALSWSERSGIEILAWTGGSLPNPINILKGRSIVNYLSADYLPQVTSNEDKAALAFYREGISLDNPFYSFLSLYKAISVIFPKGKDRADWIDNTLSNLDDNHAKERCDQLVKSGIDVGQYIWDEGRNAIAHAERKPYVNPDDVDDHFRLHQDIPLLKNLAELAIEQQKGIRRSHTIWNDHLYELNGFRDIIDRDILDKLENSEVIAEGTLIELPDKYAVLAKREAEIYAFEDMVVELAGQVEGGMVLDFVSRDDAIRIRTELKFSDERLNFDPIGGIGFLPNREDQKFINYEIKLLKFQRCILSNGHIEIWDSDAEIMLGRSETYLPLNCFVNDEFYTSELEKLNELISK